MKHKKTPSSAKKKLPIKRKVARASGKKSVSKKERKALTNQQEAEILKAENLQLRDAVKRRTVELEHKNRELQIEAAMERVRARAMAMHNSEELSALVAVLFEELTKLNLLLYRCIIWIFNPQDLTARLWMANSEENERARSYFIKKLDHTYYKTILKGWRQRKATWVYDLKGKEKKTIDALLLKDTELAQLPASVKKGILASAHTIVSGSFNNFGLIEASGPNRQTEEQLEIISRFGKVFDQTYTRFLDLQKAEAQAREAKIEAALEKVRSRSLAMHHSNELSAVVTALLGRLVDLGLSFNAALIWTFNRDKKDVQIWIATSVLPDPVRVKLPYDEKFKDNLIIKQIWHSIEYGVDVINEVYKGEVKNQYFEYNVKYNDEKVMPKHLRELVAKLDWTVSYAAEKNSLVGVDSWSGQLLSIDDVQILKRFAKVFEQAYVRFLDLQKAEAQAREAQIEAALERVRSRTMAMQKSEDLHNVVKVLHAQLKELDFRQGAAAIMIMDSVTGDIDWWMEGFDSGYDLPEKYHVPYFDHRAHQEQIMHWKSGTPYAVVEIAGQDKKSFDNYYFLHTDFFRVPENTKQFMMQQEAVLFSMAYMQYGALFWSPSPISDEQSKLLQRFAKVFEQSYTRFIDLQKAEAQARESQIQLALERLRAKTMAMHKSAELAEAAAVMWEQLTELGASLWICGFNICSNSSDMVESWVSPPDGNLMDPLFIPYSVEYFTTVAYEKWKNQGEMYTDIMEGDELQRSHKELLQHPSMAQARNYLIENNITMPTWVQRFAVPNKVGYLTLVVTKPFHERNILVNFSKVFEQTYTRFLDIQKAEAQAREAQIEAALERVRSRSMAMHKSEELREVLQLIFEQLRELNFNIDSAQFNLSYKESDDLHVWTAIPGQPYPTQQFIPYFNNPILDSVKQAKQNGLTFFSHVTTHEEKNEFFLHFFNHVGSVPEERKKYILGRPGYARSVVFLDNLFLGIQNYAGIPYTETENTVLRRFGKVFEQTYTRFLDLQRAEAQAREAQIQLALERVRARTMAMQRSDELAEAAQLLYQQFHSLGIKTYTCAYMFIKEEQNLQRGWTVASDGTLLRDFFDFPLTGDPILDQRFQAWKDRQPIYEAEIHGEANKQHHEYLVSIQPPEFAKHIVSNLPHQVFFYNANFSHGYLFIVNTVALTQEEKDIAIRFARVFEQTYTRFLDLQKAEAQAREAQVEGALERVRSRSMAMHKSEEFPQVIQVVFEQFLLLDFKIDSAQFDVSFRETDDLNLWTAAPGQPYPTKLHIPYADKEIFNSIKKAKKAGHAFVSIQLTKEEKNDFFNYFFLHAPNIPEERKKLILSSPGIVRSAVLLEKVSLAIQNYSVIPYSDAEHNILKRFAKAFEQTYVRFLDLQKAEAQAREAIIEAALEKVRGKAMAMHNSDDLIATAGVLFAEMRKLGINTFRCGVGLLTKESRKAKLYSATTTNETDNLPMVGSALLDGHEVLTEMYDRWLRNEDYFPLMKGELLKTYYEKINSTFTVPIEQTEQYEQHGYFLPFSEGLFYGWAEKPYTEDEIKILHRFKAIVDLTFRRYMELQKSEEIAREAVRSASLDRVRAEIASMRTKQDLERITPLIWKELTTLGIPFVRCGVFIMDEQEELIHTFLSTPDGKAIAAFHVPYDSTPLAGSIEFWREKKMYLTHWGLKEYAEFADAFIDTNEVEKRAHYLSSVPTGGIHLHLLPFMQGMLYVGNTDPLTEDNLHLVQSVADAFSTAYARYEDFNKIESAKAQAERTLVDLKQAQQQLVQSEKMASLGELTAGIAHEIQNPLNFVNNFSEVSNELIKEIQDIRHKTQDQSIKTEEDEILKDIASNLEKINHHGKRAADIVKGMLQHSRSSSGVKEPTDINALADEYLRLAYHGLRAKDKSFNATMKTEFDETISNINIIPQDIGRVILNLITNAFYVVNEKSKQNFSGYEPTVSVSTKKEGSKVLISVNDNGNGIPASIKEKIFQPFFTTKPTGQGTGLGLSLSYDIVKAHGGELKMETNEGTGSEFIIVLPIV